jgi:hypothetical protein
MTRNIMSAAALMAMLLLSAQVPANAQTETTTKPAKKHVVKKETKKAETESERQIRELREQMQSQQSQIDALQSQLAAKGSQAASAQQAASNAQAQAAAAAASAAQANTAAADTSTKVDTLSSSVTDMKSTEAGVQQTLVDSQQHIQEMIDSPAQLHYKGITITPVAFFAFEGVWRQHATNSDINTPFNSIPFPNAAEGHVSELNFSGRQSRLGGLFEGNAGNYKLSGYFEADFLGTGTSSNNNQSNSYVLRQRQIWGKAETQSGFAVTGGQMWSLVTEDGKSTDARTEKLPNTIDPQYMVGFSWTRQPGIRLQQRFGDVNTGAFTVAVAAEQAQITSYTLNGTGPTDYFFAGGGTNGGLYNAAANTSGAFITTYANNVAPDVIVKGALDLPKAHFELGGLGRFLRDNYNPVSVVNTGTNVLPVLAYQYNTSKQLSNTKTAGGVFGSARVSPAKFVDLAVQAMAGQGVGRYGSSQLADATLRPDETLEPLRNYHGMASIETHPAKKLDVYFYYGGEYAQRTVYANGIGGLMGYGIPTNNNSSCYNAPVAVVSPGTLGAGNGGTAGVSACGGPTRYIQEAMGGLTYRAINSPKYGRLQYQVTYSYIQRNLWSGTNIPVAPATGPVTGPTGPRATEPMIHVGMRYYIP